MRLSGGARKARRILIPKVGSNSCKSDRSQVSRKAGKGLPYKAVKVERKKNKIKPRVEEARDVKPRRKRVVSKREKGDALIIKSKQSKYSDVIKAMRSDAKLVNLGGAVRSIRRTRSHELILELKRDKERKSAAYKSLAEEVHGEKVVVRALTQEATLKVKNLDEVTEVEELVMVLRQCEVQVANAAVRLRKRPAGHR